MMAAVQQRPAVARTELDWADLYEGTQAELVAAGLAAIDQFPGQPGRPDDVAVYYKGEEISRFERRRKDTENLVYVCRQSQERFQIFVGQPPEERARRRGALLAEADRKTLALAHAVEASARVEKRLQQLSTSLQPADS